MAYLRVKTGPNQGTVFEIQSDVLTLGRDGDQTIQILDHGVSRAHAEIFRIGEMCFVRDLGSTNGTCVNGARMIEEQLKPGDEVVVGATTLVFEDDLLPAEGTKGERETGFRLTTVEAPNGKPPPGDEPRAVGRSFESPRIALAGQMAEILQETHDVAGIYRKAVELVCDVIRAGNGYFFRVDRETGKLTIQAAVEREGSGDENQVSRTIVNRVIQTGMPLLTTDAVLDGRFDLSESIVLRKIKSVICVPVRVGTQVEGLFYFHSNRLGYALGVEDLELVACITFQFSVALFYSAESGALMTAAHALVKAMELAEPRDEGHARRVDEYSAVMAARMGIPRAEVERIRLAALLHDVGKIATRRPQPGLSPDQLKAQHIHAAERIMAGAEKVEDILPGIRYHHEFADGSGFPYRLKNEDIPVMARIIIVANAFDNACVSGGVPREEAVRTLAGERGRKYDEDVIAAFLACHGDGSLYASLPAHS